MAQTVTPNILEMEARRLRFQVLSGLQNTILLKSEESGRRDRNKKEKPKGIYVKTERSKAL